MDPKKKEELIAFLSVLGVTALTLALAWTLWAQRGG